MFEALTIEGGVGVVVFEALTIEGGVEVVRGVLGVWCLTPLSTIFQLYRDCHAEIKCNFVGPQHFIYICYLH